jgi:hypothetical protein
MGSQFINTIRPNCPDGVPLKPEELPRGLVESPQLVLDLVAREASRLPMNEEAKKRITEDLTLQYYFEGWDVAYRRTPLGVEIFAVGLEEVGAYMRTTPPEKRVGVVVGQP